MQSSKKDQVIDDCFYAFFIVGAFVDIKSYWNSWRGSSSTAGEQDPNAEQTPLTDVPNPDPAVKTGDKAQAQQTPTTKVAINEDSAKPFSNN